MKKATKEGTEERNGNFNIDNASSGCGPDYQIHIIIVL
jgi:hypothetical protein